MVTMQLILLKIGLDHRPAPATKGGEAGLPFAGAAQDGIFNAERPYNFWQWRSPKPCVAFETPLPCTSSQSSFPPARANPDAPRSYWQFLLYLFIGLVVLELVLAPVPSVYPLYSSLIGVIGLSVEATLPLPQILANSRSRSCKGFRVSVLASWLLGDAMKMIWFFTSASTIPAAFKVCGTFQAMCDCFLGLQYFMYGDGPGGVLEAEVKDHPMTEMGWQPGTQHAHGATRSMTPTRRPVQFPGAGAD